MLFTEPVWPSCVLLVLWNLFVSSKGENEMNDIVDDCRHVPLPNSASDVKFGFALDVGSEVEVGLFLL